MPLKTSVFSRANPDQQDSTQENSELINQQLYLARVALHLMQSRSQASENARIKYSQSLGKTHKITHGRETTPMSLDGARERHAQRMLIQTENQKQREKLPQQIGQERIKETLIDAKKVALAEQPEHFSSHSSNRDTSADSFNKNGAGGFKKISRISKNRSQWKKFKEC